MSKYNDVVVEFLEESELFEDDVVLLPIGEVSASTVKVTKDTKRSRVAGSVAINMAKSVSDPLYKQYKKHYDLMKQAKSKIQKKYGSKSKREAKQKMG